MPKSLFRLVFIDLYPAAIVGLASLLQRERDVAEWAPTARIEQMCFGGSKMIKSNFHRMAISRVLQI